jgi:spheroidene monooxygenase
MAALQPADPGVAVLLMFRLRRAAVPWALWRLARGAAGLGRVPGLRFARVLGSGHQGGFGLKPGLDCQGVFAFFDTVAQASDFAAHSAAAQAYRARALEHFSVVLQATSARGSWAGHRLAAQGETPASGLVAALTRAAIRPSRARSFWRHSPGAEAELASTPGCLLAVGLGEAPLLRQATFSLWESVAAMDGYARHGSHQRAIQASWQRGFFSEWMFARFRPLALQGSWHGQRLDEPLDAQLAAH